MFYLDKGLVVLGRLVFVSFVLSILVLAAGKNLVESRKNNKK